MRKLTDADAADEGIVVRRHKRSLTNITAWCPELREAWDHLAARRDTIWRERRHAVPIAPEARWLVVTEFGDRLGAPRSIPHGGVLCSRHWKRRC